MSKSLYTTIIEETAPLSTTVGVVGQLYLDSSTKILYQCVAINIDDLTYEWKQIGGVSQEDVEELKKDVNTLLTIDVIKDYTVEENGTVTPSNMKTGYTYQPSNNLNLTIPTLARHSSVKMVAEQLNKVITGELPVGGLAGLSARIETIETSLTEITPKVMKALVTPMSAPSKTELVAVDDGNAQTMIEIGDGIVLENGVLKSKYWEEVIYSDNGLFKTNTTYNFTKAVGSYETIELELRSGGHNSSYFVKMKTIPSGGNTNIYIPEHNDSVLNQIVISFTDTSMTVENSLLDLTDYDNWVLQKIRWIHR